MIRQIFFFTFSLTFITFYFLPSFVAAGSGSPDTATGDIAEIESLFTAMNYTLEKNPEVMTARESVRAYEATLKSEEKQRLPGVSLDTTIEDDNEDSKAYIRVTQPLWVGGRIHNAIEKAKIQLELSQTQLLRVQRDLMEETVVAFTNVTGLTERLRAARLNIDEHEKLLELITRRKKGKISSEADVMLAKSRYSQALMTDEDLKGQYQVALNDLFALTRTPMNRFEPVPGDLLELPGHAKVEAEVTGASPRLKMADLEISAARIERLISRSEFYPRVYGRLDQDIYDKEGTSNQHRDTTVALVIQGALDGIGFRTLDQVRASEARIQAAQMQSNAEKNEINRTTRSLLTEKDLARQLKELNESLVQSTGDTLASYSRQYEAGRKNWLDLLNIQREHSNARLALEQTKSRYEQACLRLAVQMGKLDSQSGLSQ